jgi:hypothetical protein
VHHGSRTGPNYFGPLEHPRPDEAAAAAAAAAGMGQQGGPSARQRLEWLLEKKLPLPKAMAQLRNRHSLSSRNGHATRVAGGVPMNGRRHRFMIPHRAPTTMVSTPTTPSADKKIDVPKTAEVVKSESKNEVKEVVAAQTVATLTPSTSSTTTEEQPQSFLSAFLGRAKQLFPASTPSSSPSSDTPKEGLLADSVKRKRGLKMKRHKLKKRAKLARNKNIGAK